MTQEKSARSVVGKISLVAAIWAASAVPVLAQDDPTARTGTYRGQNVGFSIGLAVLLGPGISVGTNLGEYFNVRGVYNGITINRQFDDDKGNYDGKVRLRTFGALLDYHPFAGVFRLTTGLISNGNRITLHGRPANGAEFDVGDCSYVSSSTDPLLVDGAVNFRRSTAYAGVGWGGHMSADPGFYATFDVGALLAVAPRVRLDASGSARAQSGQSASCGSQTTDTPVTSNPQFQDQLAVARKDAQDSADKLKFWPAIQFGLGWRF